jgi:hypothetical protein
MTFTFHCPLWSPRETVGKQKFFVDAFGIKNNFYTKHKSFGMQNKKKKKKKKEIPRLELADDFTRATSDFSIIHEKTEFILIRNVLSKLGADPHERLAVMIHI